MSGPKWEAADWTVNSFLGTLTERDRFALGLFHTTTKWFDREPRRATDENLRAAARYLDENRDAGGTNLGIALEQALQLPRSDVEGDLARHVLIVTDAQVSDASRLFRLADRETQQDDARRISLICIDAAPNSFLANELAERGGGVAHFLTSSPDEEDVTTALEGVLTDWAEPLLVDLRLEVDRAGAQAAGRQVEATDGATTIDVGDLPRGRAVWAAGRMPAEEKPGGLTFRLATATKPIATHRTDGEEADLPALKPLFGARNLLALEHLIHARYAVEDLAAQVARLGYDPDRLEIGGESVYAENALRSAQEALTPLLIEESLRYGIACAETSFIAVREEAGERVGATTVVANALPPGWSDAFLSPGMAAVAPSIASGMRSTAAVMRKSVQVARVADAGAPSQGTGGMVDVFSGAPHPADGEAVLYDATDGDELPDETVLTRLSLRFDGGPPSSVDRGLELLIYVGDPAMPRATVRLADLVRTGGGRPLNVRRSAGEMVRIVLVDPNGAWASGGPALTVELAWRRA
jgi:Ca-activated chloride channel family protein